MTEKLTQVKPGVKRVVTKGKTQNLESKFPFDSHLQTLTLALPLPLTHTESDTEENSCDRHSRLTGGNSALSKLSLEISTFAELTHFMASFL